MKKFNWRKSSIRKTYMAAGLLFASAQLFALPLSPGGTVVPVTITLNASNSQAPAGSPVASDWFKGTAGALNRSFSWKFNPSSPNAFKLGGSGTFLSAVYLDPATQELDFYYQVLNTFGGSTTLSDTLNPRFTISGFKGFDILNVVELRSNTTQDLFGNGGSVEFQGTTPGTISNVQETLAGKLVVNLKAGLKPGSKSSVLLVKTSAKNFQLGSASFNWQTAPTGCRTAPSAACGNAYAQSFTLDALEPFLVPEPGFYGVLSMGIAGLLFAGRRRSKKSGLTV